MATTVRGHLVRMFPALAGRRITHAWGGPIDVSPSHVPQVGTLPGAPVHFAFGYTGNGVGPSHLAGRILAALALDRRDERTRLPIVESSAGAWVPPEPLAWLGGSLVRSAHGAARARRGARRAHRPAHPGAVRGAAGARDAPRTLSGSGPTDLIVRIAKLLFTSATPGRPSSVPSNSSS